MPTSWEDTLRLYDMMDAILDERERVMLCDIENDRPYYKELGQWFVVLEIAYDTSRERRTVNMTTPYDLQQLFGVTE